MKRNKVVCKCIRCNVEFLVKPSELLRDNGRGKYCSLICYNKSRGEHLDRNCLVCGNVFHSRSDRLQKGGGLYCSKTCSGVARRNQVTLICKQCGTSYKAKKAHEYTSRFCSTVCQNLWRSQNIFGSLHPLWRGGRSPYPETWGRPFRRYIRQRDGDKCAICCNEGNLVHHIDEDKQNTTPENCIVLCRSCHGKYHGALPEYRKNIRDTLRKFATQRERA